ncbi:16316_t:CDS:2, partial [Racocetra fulgida]
MAIPDKFESQDLLQFYNLRNIINQRKAFGYESFPGTFLDPKLENAMLQPNIQNLLVKFYNVADLGYQFTKPRRPVMAQGSGSKKGHSLSSDLSSK